MSEVRRSARLIRLAPFDIVAGLLLYAFLTEIDPKQAAKLGPPRPVGTSASPLEESPGPE